MQYAAELRVSLRRLDAFLSMPEPPPPEHQRETSVHAPGHVSMGGADYDWGRQMDEAGDGSAHGGFAASGGAAGGDRARSSAEAAARGSAELRASVDVPRPLTLSGVRFALAPGELLGVTGNVGAGKSSVLAALLGELLPLPSQRDGPGARSLARA